MKNVIIIEWEASEGFDHHIQAWSSLTEICKQYDLPYHTLKTKDFPFEWNGYKFQKLKINR